MRSLSNLLIAFVFCTIVGNATAANINPQVIQLGSGIKYKLMPNDPQLISNQYLWTAKAVCTIINKDEENFLSIKVTKKEGTLNDEVLVAGDSRVLRLRHKDEISISAKSGAEVELLNIGKNPIVTECSFSF